MIRLLRVELEKLIHSHLFYSCFVLFLVYAVVMYFGFHNMMARLGRGPGHDSGASYMYMAMLLSYYPFLAAVAIIFAGGSISQEMRAGTLRYSLLAPVSRWQYLVAKYLVLMVTMAAVILFLFLALGGIGTLLLGQGNVWTSDFLKMAKPEGREATLFSDQEILRRCLLALPLLLWSTVANASFAFLISTLVTTPLLAITIPLSLFFISSVIQFSPFLTDLKPYLPTRHMFFWDDVFARDIAWERIAQGATFHGVLVAVFAGLALLIFVTRDVTS